MILCNEHAAHLFRNVYDIKTIKYYNITVTAFKDDYTYIFKISHYKLSQYLI